MNITRENFNQYAEIATDLAAKGLFAESTDITLKLFEAWDNWSDEETDDSNEILIAQVVRTLTCSQWRCADNPESYAVLAEILKSNKYWSDDLIESNWNYTGAWIMSEKALAYHMLAQNWAQGQLCGIYQDYARMYMESAINLFEEIAKEENDQEAAELCVECKIDLVMIQLCISNKLARQTAISLFGESLDEVQKERLMAIYEEATDVLFNDFFNKAGIGVVMQSEIEDDMVKEEVINHLLEQYAETGNDDRDWWRFTHKNTPEERKKIRFVEKIEDASNNNFDEIPWVFTLDRYPFDIEFADGEKPTDASVYEIDTENTALYHRI